MLALYTSVELLADYSSYTVTARQLGPNSSVVNGHRLSYGSSAQLKHNDIVEVSEDFSVDLKRGSIVKCLIIFLCKFLIVKKNSTKAYICNIYQSFYILIFPMSCSLMSNKL